MSPDNDLHLEGVALADNVTNNLGQNFFLVKSVGAEFITDKKRRVPETSGKIRDIRSERELGNEVSNFAAHLSVQIPAVNAYSDEPKGIIYDLPPPLLYLEPVTTSAPVSFCFLRSY